MTGLADRGEVWLRTRQERVFRRRPIVLATLAALGLWTVLTGFSLYWNITNLYDEKVKLAIAEARSIWNKDLAFRRWATRHGGVYVPPNERTPPNPYLAHLPDRDVETTDGKKLTLMNPAYMMRQMAEEFEKEFGIKGKITGKVQINPVNAPDGWELKALNAFERGVKEVIEQSEIDGKPYLRYMKPMYMTEGCVKCHGFLGFKEGDLRGGIGVSVPLQPYLDAAADTARSMKITHGLVWFIGVTGILLFSAFTLRRHRERLQLLARLEHDALHDELTGLPNRLLFADRVDRAIRRKARNPSFRFAVCFLDLDRFKNINDSYDHQVGDQILVQAADRFRRTIRPTDTVARIGGDEFTFLLEGFDADADAVLVAERILKALEQPFDLTNGRLYISASVGICFGDPRYETPEELIRDADTAMYRAKEAGRDRVHVFDPEMHRQAMLLIQLENDLREAIEKGQLEVHYQPIVDLDTTSIDGFEALARWHHPELGYVSPEQFIPVAEETGMIISIGAWIMERACREVAAWNREFGGDRRFFVSVNLSGRQLIQGDLVATIDEILDKTGLPPDRLHCEITETILIEHRDSVAAVIDRLRDRGIGISLDDFGKGYCSLTYLHEFRFDHLKIDKSFVQDMQEDSKGLSLVKTIVSLAAEFDARLVAEGVETLDQAEKLHGLKCHWAQGYYFHRPSAPDVIRSLLEQGRHQGRDSRPSKGDERELVFSKGSLVE